MHKIRAVKTTYIKNELLTRPGVSAKGNLEDLQISLYKQELQTNYKYLTFENNYPATEDRKCVCVHLRDRGFLFLSSTLWNRCVPWIVPTTFNEKNPAWLSNINICCVELNFSSLFFEVFESNVVYMGFQESWKCKRFVLELIFIDLSQRKSQSKNVEIEIKLPQRIEVDFETRQNGSIIQKEHSEETVWR